MKRFIFYTILIIIGLLAGCRKIELEPNDGEPVFTANAKFNGAEQIWEAGIGGYYMYSSFEKDAFDVLVFKGKIAQADTLLCCTKTLEFLFRDSRENVDVFEINRAISSEIDYYFADYSGNNTTLVLVNDTTWLTNFVVSSYAQPQQSLVYEWDFGDGNSDSSILDSITHIYDLVPNNQPVTLITKAMNNSCSSYFTRNISAPNNTSSNCNLGFNIDLDSLSNNSILITANATGIPPYSYFWSDSTTSSSFQADPSSFSGPFVVNVTVTDASGCTISAGLSSVINPGTVPQICVASFDFNIQQNIEVDSQLIITPLDSLQFSAMTIIHEDKLGNQYRSDRQPQLPSASIRIIDVADYEINEKGQKTKKISLLYTCRVWNELGEFIDLSEGKATIAVAYPD